MELIKMYSENILSPLEHEINVVRSKLYKNKFSLTKRSDKHYLEKLENLLFKYYQNLEILMDKEIKFDKCFSSKY